MWKCKECGEEVQLLVEAEKTYQLGKNHEDEQEQIDENTSFEYFMCDCGKQSKNDVHLEDIAEWVEDEEND